MTEDFDTASAGSASPNLKLGKRKGPPTRAVSTIDRLPPHSEEAEQGVLGCVFLMPHECMGECMEQFKAGGDVFYDLRHRTIYELLLEMYERKEAIDVITVQQRLKDRHQLESVGGIAYLATLPDTVPSAANISYYINIVREKYVLRKMVSTCTEIVGRIYEHEGEVDSLIDEVETDILGISEDRATSTAHSMRDHMHGALERMDVASKNPGVIPGISTGYRGIDKNTLGMAKGDMIVVAARPSLGKTSLAYNIADNVASLGEPVGFISLEMLAKQLADRHISARARVDSKRIRTGDLSEAEITRITTAAAAISKLPIHIDDERGITVLQLRSKMRRMQQRYGCRLFIIDYMQKLQGKSQRGGNRNQEVAEMSNGIKDIAGELDVPVIVLAQLNREIEKADKHGKTRPPQLSDLRESGAIEQDADEIHLLHRPSSNTPEVVGDEDDWIDVDDIIAKQRNGSTGTAALRFFRRFTLYVDRPTLDTNEPDTGWNFGGNS